MEYSPEETVGMIHARRWAAWVPGLFLGVIFAAIGWKAALIFFAVNVTIRLEVNRVLAATWPECYHAARKAIKDDRDPD